MCRTFHALAAGFLLLILAALPVSAQVGPPGGMIYADDRLFATVGTPTELPERGPFNDLYQLGGSLSAVSDAGPGSPGYRGGRWAVREVTFVTIAPVQFTNADDLLAAASRGEITIGPVVRRFECPLIPKR
ncbi:MAG: hypothetical protein ACREOU_15855 [Candidatus Eiseniibacteriota bacterium]